MLYGFSEAAATNRCSLPSSVGTSVILIWKTDRIGLERPLGRLLTGDRRHPTYATALKATMQRRTRQMWDARLERVQAVVQGHQGVLRYIECGASGPIYASCANDRLRHLATVSRFRPLASRSERVRGRGAAVKYLAHSSSRNEGSSLTDFPKLRDPMTCF
jgi:hypothetical protein